MKPLHYRYFSGMLVLLFVLFNGLASAAPAYPGLIQYQQPNGGIIEILLKGDEKINWAETTDGYTLLATRTGEYQYAIQNLDGDLVASGVAVSPPGKRSLQEQQFLSGIPQGLFFNESQIEMMLSVWEMREKHMSKSFPTTGQQKMLCILAETNDVRFNRKPEDFDALFNQLNYTAGGASGSIRDYYLENSWGQFDLIVDVVGPVRVSKQMAYYAESGKGREFAREAVEKASQEVDFSEYDNTGNGSVDGIYIIFAGYGQEAGGGSNTIWSHAWSISPALYYNNTSISRYACSPELRGNAESNPTRNITRIGVIGHEFGHILGAPDYYDTDQHESGGNFPGTGQWDMMAGGTWNNGGATPAHHNPYTKIYIYNWAEVVELDTPLEELTLKNSVEYDNSFFRINTYTPGEYFLLENRQQLGFDLHVPGQGLLVYHVHSGIAAASPSNTVNVGHPQMLYLVNAGAFSNPDASPFSYGEVNSDRTPYPGITNNTSFTDYSIPNSHSWAGIKTNKPITGIVHDTDERTITFTFMDDVEPVISEWLHWDTGVNAGSIGLQSGGKFQIAARYDNEDTDQMEARSISKIAVYINERASVAKAKVWQGYDQYNLVEYLSVPLNQMERSWAMIELDPPYIINPDQELWIGAEFETNEGVYPAGRDDVPDNDGKGNMVRTHSLDDPEAWTTLSSFNIYGNWNVQALLHHLDEPASFTTISLAAEPAEAGTVKGYGYFPLGREHTVKAIAENNFGFVHWEDEDGEVISTDEEFSFLVEDSRELTAVFGVVSSVNSIQQSHFSVFPNPANNFLNISLEEGHEFTELALFNYLGQRVWSKTIGAGTNLHTVSLEHLNAGIYHLQLNSVNSSEIYKLIKQ